jgi:hypothetical protein
MTAVERAAQMARHWAAHSDESLAASKEQMSAGWREKHWAGSLATQMAGRWVAALAWTTAAYLAAHSVWQKAGSMAARTVFATAALRDGHWAALWAFRLADCWVWRSVAWTVTTMAARTDERKAAQKAGC